MARLDAFFTEHRQGGDLDASVDGDIVWMACDCGAGIAWRGDEEDDARRQRSPPEAHPLAQEDAMSEGVWLLIGPFVFVELITIGITGRSGTSAPT